MGATHEVPVRIQVNIGHKLPQEDVAEFSEMCIKLMLRHRIRVMKFWINDEGTAEVRTIPEMQSYERAPFSDTLKKIYAHIHVPGIKIDLGEHAMALAESNAVDLTTKW